MLLSRVYGRLLDILHLAWHLQGRNVDRAFGLQLAERSFMRAAGSVRAFSARSLEGVRKVLLVGRGNGGGSQRPLLAVQRLLELHDPQLLLLLQVLTLPHLDCFLGFVTSFTAFHLWVLKL